MRPRSARRRARPDSAEPCRARRRPRAARGCDGPACDLARPRPRFPIARRFPGQGRSARGGRDRARRRRRAARASAGRRDCGPARGGAVPRPGARSAIRRRFCSFPSTPCSSSQPSASCSALLRRDELPDPPALADACPPQPSSVSSSLSLLWTEDLRAGTIELLFFLLPFAVLAAFVARAALAAWSTRAFAVTIVLLACGFAAVGLSQLWTGELYFARDLEVANAYTSYFRTTSLFADSSMYGRELAARDRRAGRRRSGSPVWACRSRSRVIALLWTGLYFTYSQSSMVALVVAVLAVSLVAADRRSRRGPGRRDRRGRARRGGARRRRGPATSRSSASTSGRFALVENTWQRLRRPSRRRASASAASRAASRDQDGARTQTERNASHTTPLTVAAELGLVGIVAYLASCWPRLPALVLAVGDGGPLARTGALRRVRPALRPLALLQRASSRTP